MFSLNCRKKLYQKSLFLILALGINLTFSMFKTPLVQAGLVDCSISNWSQQALLALVNRLGYYPLFYFCYEINTGSTQNLTITFDERDVIHSLNHYIMAECDQDCSNINLKVYNENNQLIGQDLDPNNSFARVRVNNISNGKKINVKLTMSNCQTDYCGAVLATNPI